jgi:hypothetical protein
LKYQSQEKGAIILLLRNRQFGQSEKSPKIEKDTIVRSPRFGDKDEATSCQKIVVSLKDEEGYIFEKEERPASKKDKRATKVMSRGCEYSENVPRVRVKAAKKLVTEYIESGSIFYTSCVLSDFIQQHIFICENNHRLLNNECGHHEIAEEEERGKDEMGEILRD